MIQRVKLRWSKINWLYSLQRTTVRVLNDDIAVKEDYIKLFLVF